MRPAYEYGQEVRLIRNVRNDGTYPGMATGALLVRRGSVGCVYDVGTYLQDQLIYRVHFLDAGRTIGCRQEELISATDHWVPSQFEYRDNVAARIPLSIGGKIAFPAGQEGSVVKVLRDAPGGVQYHVHFGKGRVLQVPEAALLPVAGAGLNEGSEDGQVDALLDELEDRDDDD